MNNLKSTWHAGRVCGMRNKWAARNATVHVQAETRARARRQAGQGRRKTSLDVAKYKTKDNPSVNHNSFYTILRSRCCNIVSNTATPTVLGVTKSATDLAQGSVMDDFSNSFTAGSYGI